MPPADSTDSVSVAERKSPSRKVWRFLAEGSRRGAGGRRAGNPVQVRRSQVLGSRGQVQGRDQQRSWLEAHTGLWWSGVLLLGVVGAMLGWQALSHAGEGVPYNFAHTFKPAGLALLGGHVSPVYKNDANQAGPLLLLWLVGWWRTGRLVAGHGLGVLGAVTGAGVVWAVVTTSWLVIRELPQLPRISARIGALLAGIASLALVNVAAVSGHPSEVWICCLWVGAAVLARRRPFLAAVLVGVGMGFEPWAILGAVLLLRAPWTRIIPAGVLAGVVSLVWYLPFVVGGHFALLRHHWIIMDDTLTHAVFPGAVQVGWSLRIVQSLVIVAVAAGASLWSRLRVDGSWLAPLALILVRLLTDPLDISYYWLELGVVVLVVLAVVGGSGAFHPARSSPWWLYGVVGWLVVGAVTWVGLETQFAYAGQLLVLETLVGCCEVAVVRRLLAPLGSAIRHR